MGITVKIDNLALCSYSEYFLTGFYILKEKKIIDRLKIKYDENVKPGKLHRISSIVRNKTNLFNSDKDNIDRSHIAGTINNGFQTKEFAINILDTPWNFGKTDYLENADIYFKCQYPSDFKKGYFSITRSKKIEIPEFVMENSHKVKPLILGRPLSRSFDFPKNLKILKKYEEKRKFIQRKNKILIYLGMATDNVYIPDTHHPHLKRAMMAKWANRNIPDKELIFKLSKQENFLNQLTPEIKSLANNSIITDKKYLNLIQSSFSTLNITGLRGSIPFRFIDSFLSGMVLISDNVYVDWYEPLIPGKDFLSIGELGYEKLEDISFEDSCGKLKDYLENIEDIFIDTADYREEKFENYYSPEAVAKYILIENGML